ncbi:ufaA1 [Symbiodinium microadriaticum]|nr:ufaA1 [Symbiodinium microadriaticum]
MTFRSAFYQGKVRHRRLRPKVHALNYGVFYLLADLDELPRLARQHKLFSHNKFNLISLDEGDYGDGKPIKDWVTDVLLEAGLPPDIRKVDLMTMPRILGFQFNPISLFFVYGESPDPFAVVYDVRSTFGERHAYAAALAPGNRPIHSHDCAKAMHVSPFLPMDLRYHFRLRLPGDRADLLIEETDQEGVILHASLRAERREFSDRMIVRMAVNFPLVTLKTLAAIHYEALKLWLKRVPFISHPGPAETTVTVAPKKASSAWIRNFLKLLSGIERGQITVVLPDGSQEVIKGPEPGPEAVIEVHSAAMARSLLKHGDMGLAESYLRGEWSSPDLSQLLIFGAMNENAIERKITRGWLGRLRHDLFHSARDNTKAQAKKNIEAHYDMGNEFYERWLDPSMTYSSAIFQSDDQALQAAQIAKYEAIADGVDLKPGDRVLEIGCGWGGFAEYAASTRGALVTGITLSDEQLRYARARMERQGLSDKVEIRLQDYRDVPDKFDKVVSIEMYEAVGESHWPSYFSKIAEVLKPGGRAGLQMITIDDARFDVYRRSADFIQRYIFPGGMLASPSVLHQKFSEAGLQLVGENFFGQSYARTLSEWNKSFLSAWDQIKPMGFDQRFQRLWQFYLSYCETGFATGRTDVGQFVIEKPKA